MSQEVVFQQNVRVRLAIALPDMYSVEVDPGGSFGLIIRSGEAPGEQRHMSVYLGRWWHMYYEDGESLDDIVDLIARTVQENFFDNAATWEQVQSRVMCRIESEPLMQQRMAHILREAEKFEDQTVSHELVVRPYIAGLTIAYCVDFPETILMITHAHLKKWHVTPDELHAQAMKNTGERWEKTNLSSESLELQRFGKIQTWASMTNDGYDATGVLFPALIEAWIGEPVLCFIPERDLLLCVKYSDVHRNPALGVIMQELMRDQTRNSSYPVMPLPVLCRQGQAQTVFIAPAGQPGEPGPVLSA
jgi:uncharacterized protein YtpQ (UPF0354 family)